MKTIFEKWLVLMWKNTKKLSFVWNILEGKRQKSQKGREARSKARDEIEGKKNRIKERSSFKEREEKEEEGRQRRSRRGGLRW